MNRVVGIATIILLTGCAESSGIAKTGTDEFTVTTSASPGRGGVPSAKRAAYEQARAECSRHAPAEMLVKNETASPPTWTEGMAIVTVDFRCISGDDKQTK